VIAIGPAGTLRAGSPAIPAATSWRHLLIPTFDADPWCRAKRALAEGSIRPACRHRARGRI